MMKKTLNNKLIIVACIFAVLLMIPCSFAADSSLDNSTLVSDNGVISDSLGVQGDTNSIASDSYSNLKSSNYAVLNSNVNSNDAQVTNFKDANNDDVSNSLDDAQVTNFKDNPDDVSNSIDDSSISGYMDVDGDDTILLDSDNITIKNGIGFISGELTDDDSGYGNKYTDGNVNMNCTYIDNSGISQEFTTVIKYGSLSIDLSKLNLPVRENAYVLTLKPIEDDDYQDYQDNTFYTIGTYTISVYSLEASKIYVATTGSDTTGNGSEDNPYATISKAIDANKALGGGNNVYIKEGTYSINSSIYASKSVNLIGLGNVILDMNNNTQAFSASGDFSASNINFTNSKYASSAGGCIGTTTGCTSLTLTNCSFINSLSGWKGGAVSIASGPLTVTNCTFINCSTTKTNLQGGALNCEAYLTVTNSSFINCSSKNGGAIYATSGNVSYSIFVGNTATAGASDIYSTSTLTADYNYWGTNIKPNSSLVSSAVVTDKWTILDISSNKSSEVHKNDQIKYDFDITKYTDGTTNSSLSQAMPDLTIDLTADLGSFNISSLTTSNGVASAMYTATTQGDEHINVNVPSKAEEITFTVIDENSNIIYVATNGNDATGDGSEANPYATIAKALTEVTNTKNTIYIKNGTYEENNLEITESLTIIGEDKDKVIIDGTNTGRIFKIDDSDVKVIINSLSLINGKTDPDNDYNDGDTEGMGGAIYLGSGDLTLNNTNIYNCTATAGGAIANNGMAVGNLTIVNSNFQENKIADDAADEYAIDMSGAAIFSNGKLYVDNCTFAKNDATGDDNYNGGAISVGNSAIINNCTFDSNVASGANGGAIYAYPGNQATVNITNNIFKSNSAKNGGAISSSLGKVFNIIGNIFDSNKATDNGGAIYSEGLQTYNLIKDNNFTANTAKNGGAITLRNANANLTNNTMSSNTASTLGNTIYNNGGKLNSNLTYLNNGTYTGLTGSQINLTATLTDDMGNAISGGNVNFTLNGTYVGNAAVVNGLATLAYTANNTIADYVVSGTYAGNNGVYTSTTKNGILKISKYFWFIGTQGYFTLQDAVDASVEGDTIIGLPGTYSYDEVDIGDRMASIKKNVTIKANETGTIILQGNDGRMFNVAGNNANTNHGMSSLTLVNLILENGKDEYAGAIYNDGSLTLINCTLRNNTATNPEVGSKWHGGAILNWRDLTIINSTFVNNTATAGGAICSDSLGGNFVIENTSFINNSATAEGGAIYEAASMGSEFNLTNVLFENNSASAGGAIFAVYSAPVTINNGTFINNTVVNGGGAIYASHCNLTLNDTLFANNTAQWGGALYLLQTISSTINSTETVTTVDVYNITNSKFINNSASEDGGVIYAGYNSVATGFIDNCTFVNNSALGDGGVIANYVSNVTISNSQFDNNSADNGGVIYNYGLYNIYQTTEYDGNVFVYDSNFTNNKATNGGAFYNDNAYSYMNITNSKFDNDVANATGGAIYNEGFLNLIKNQMTNCSANTANYIYNKGQIKTSNLTYINNETVSVEMGSTIRLNATITDDMGNPITGQNVTFIVNGTTIGAVEANEGKASITYSFNKGGNYTISGIYKGSEEIDYESNVFNGTIVISEIVDTNLTAENTVSIYGDGKNFTATLKDSNGNPLANQTVVLTLTNSIGGTKNYTLTTDANGVVNLPLKLVAGNYTISGVYAGNDKYNPSNFSAVNVTIKSAMDTVLTVSNSSFVTKSGENYTIKLVDENGKAVAGQEIAIKLSNSFGQSVVYWATTNTEGIAKLQINLAHPGVYNINASFAGQGKYAKSNSLGTITIVNNLTSTVLTASNMNTTRLSGKNFTARLCDINGNALAGREILLTLYNSLGQSKGYWATTNTEGYAKLPIHLAYPSTYYIVASFGGDKYTEASNSVNATLIITALSSASYGLATV